MAQVAILYLCKDFCAGIKHQSIKQHFFFKIDRAEDYGALGVIIYGDPEDFAVEGMDKVYPDYNWLPSTAVPRGSVKRAKGGGDLLTPQFPAIGTLHA